MHTEAHPHVFQLALLGFTGHGYRPSRFDWKLPNAREIIPLIRLPTSYRIFLSLGGGA